MARRRTAAKKSSADGDGSADELAGLPALFVLRPYFPGEIHDFEARWDHEEAAIRAADSGHGILALVPAGTDPDRLVLEAQDGYLVATLGTIVARSRDGVVRIRAEVRFQVLFSLSWVVAEACVLGLVRSQGVFLRTSKARSNSNVLKAATSTRTEGLLVLAAVLVGVGILLLRPGFLATVIAGLVMMQALIYANAPVNALRAEGIRLTPMRRIFRDSPQNTGQRPALAKREVRKALLATALAVIATSFLAVLATAPEGAGLQAPSDLLPNFGGTNGQAQQPQAPANGSPSPESSTRVSTSSPSPRASSGSALPAPGTTSAPSPLPTSRPGVTPSPAATSHPAPTSAPTGRPTSTPSPHH